MTDVATIRKLLREFLGETRFCEFVASAPNTIDGARLRFWQERALDDFHALHPSVIFDLADIIVVCRICYLHGCELVPAKIPVFEGCVDFAPELWEERRRHCPNARLPFISTEESTISEKEVEVWCCPTCDEIQLQGAK